MSRRERESFSVFKVGDGTEQLEGSTLNMSWRQIEV